MWFLSLLLPISHQLLLSGSCFLFSASLCLTPSDPMKQDHVVLVFPHLSHFSHIITNDWILFLIHCLRHFICIAFSLPICSLMHTPVDHCVFIIGSFIYPFPPATMPITDVLEISKLPPNTLANTFA